MTPATMISPSSAFSRPAMHRNVVVLPQPEGPSRRIKAAFLDSKGNLIDRFHPSVAAVGENLDECLNFDHVFFCCSTRSTAPLCSTAALRSSPHLFPPRDAGEDEGGLKRFELLELFEQVENIFLGLNTYPAGNFIEDSNNRQQA